MKTWNQPEWMSRDDGRTLLWTYLVPVAIVSLLLCCSGFRVIMGWAVHSSTIMTRDSLLGYALFIGSVIIFLAAGISIFLFLRKRGRWVDWAVGIGIALTLFFVTESVLQIIRGLSFGNFGYSLFLIDINMAFLAFFIRYRANHMAPVQAENPQIVKILFLIAVCSLCIETGIACAMPVCQWQMAIIGFALLIILFSIYRSGRV